ncbi:hypothetical protein L6241_10005 [Janibacter sp. Y6]|uniref:hypothetical protein n=1 Tax=Janibacter sp. Y6 TaxID=2913552 RepID=UPI0034A457FF
MTYDPKYDAPRAATILGREPAAWVGLIEATIALLVVFALGVTTESAVLIMAAVSAAAGLYTAWATKDTALGAVLGLAKAAISLAAYYGLQLTPSSRARSWQSSPSSSASSSALRPRRSATPSTRARSRSHSAPRGVGAPARL